MVVRLSDQGPFQNTRSLDSPAGARVPEGMPERMLQAGTVWGTQKEQRKWQEQEPLKAAQIDNSCPWSSASELPAC